MDNILPLGREKQGDREKTFPERNRKHFSLDAPGRILKVFFSQSCIREVPLYYVRGWLLAAAPEFLNKADVDTYEQDDLWNLMTFMLGWMPEDSIYRQDLELCSHYSVLLVTSLQSFFNIFYKGTNGKLNPNTYQAALKYLIIIQCQY